jgi:hypothetical protein
MAPHVTSMPMRLLLIIAVAVPLLAQPGYWKHNARLGLGAGVPGGDLRPFFSDSVALGAGYGYRFHRNFQADAGLDTVFGAARVRDFYESPFGALRIRDYQFLVPVGGRAILPLLGDRFQLYGGGGGVYMRYSERMRQPFDDPDFHLSCPVCRNRSGWGYYTLLGTSVALDSSRHFRFSLTAKMYRGNTGGDSFGSVPAIRTYDRWLSFFGGFGFSF